MNLIKHYLIINILACLAHCTSIVGMQQTPKKIEDMTEGDMAREHVRLAQKANERAEEQHTWAKNAETRAQQQHDWARDAEQRAQAQHKWNEHQAKLAEENTAYQQYKDAKQEEKNYANNAFGFSIGTTAGIVGTLTMGPVGGIVTGYAGKKLGEYAAHRFTEDKNRDTKLFAAKFVLSYRPSQPCGMSGFMDTQSLASRILNPVIDDMQKLHDKTKQTEERLNKAREASATSKC